MRRPLLLLMGLVLQLLLLLALLPMETIAECWSTRGPWLWLLVGVELRSWVLPLMLRRLVGEHGGGRLRGRIVEAHDQPAAVVRGVVGSVRGLPGHRGSRLRCLRQRATEALLSQLRLQCLHSGRQSWQRQHFDNGASCLQQGVVVVTPMCVLPQCIR